jgi:hypothetical protein
MRGTIATSAGTSVEINKQPTPVPQLPDRARRPARDIAAPRIPRLCDGLPVRLSQLHRFLTCANDHSNLSNEISIVEFVLLKMDGGNVRVFVSFDRGGIRTDPYLAKMASGQQERSPQGAMADLPAHFSERGDNQ